MSKGASIVLWSVILLVAGVVVVGVLFPVRARTFSPQIDVNMEWSMEAETMVSSIATPLYQYGNGRPQYPENLADFVSAAAAQDAQLARSLRPTTRAIRAVHPAAAESWKLIGGVLVRRSMKGMRHHDVIAIAVPLSELVNPPVVYLTCDLQSHTVDPSEPTEQAGLFQESIGGLTLWD
ncbi:MAG: hypothetical protein ACK51N_05890 [bacterium]|jgi:hypothetical protein|nr:hypothetical protein [Phycisphaerales bacterium]MCE2652975.1 hypothetical protein [Planctomycetaceae bacterium]